MIRSLFRFSFSSIQVPRVNLSAFLSGSTQLSNCEQILDSFHKYGCVIVDDPRVKPSYNDEFLNMMEKYFHSRAAQLYAGQKIDDVYPEYGFQTGATPEFKELAKPHPEVLNSYIGSNKATTGAKPEYDAKWRYFWRIGERPAGERSYDPPKCIPKDFPDFEMKMNRWGNLMIDAVFTVSEMLALGYGMQKNTFTDILKGGPHLLAPTGSDLVKYKTGTIFANFHYDFNFLTIHGKSRYPGLFVWLRTGEKVSVAVPEGCLLLQAGKQLEIVTGGQVTNGFHEVVYTPEVEAAKNRALKEGRIPWRVSSTLFSHIRYDVDLEPLDKFKNAETVKKYPKMKAYDYVEKELKDISLAQ